MKTLVTYPTLIDATFSKRTLLLDVVLVLGFSCLTALCAQITFWIGLVPVTCQTFAVLLAGALLGSRRGALSQITYLAIGATGIPYWFALGGPLGIARLVGPTGGYLFGFIAAAFVVGWLVEKGWDRRVWTAVVAMVAGSVAMYLFGLSWLSLFVQRDALLQTGLYPFIIGDAIKIVSAAIVLPSGWLLLKRFVH
ncbi:biotin transporter BioY [Chloroflexota bacterium]